MEDGERKSRFRNESEQWGQASNAIVQLIMQEQVVAIVTSDEGRIAHQAEQIVTKLGAPVLTLASDPTTTRINIPLIFRIGPSDAEQAKAIVAEIYRSKDSPKVLLIAESDYDGRIGGDAFLQAASSAGHPAPERIDFDTAKASLTDLLREINGRKPDVVVVWGGSRLAEGLVSGLPTGVSIDLSQKAAGFMGIAELQGANARVVLGGPGLKNQEFSRIYKAETGAEEGIVAQ